MVWRKHADVPDVPAAEYIFKIRDTNYTIIPRNIPVITRKSIVARGAASLSITLTRDQKPPQYGGIP